MSKDTTKPTRKKFQTTLASPVRLALSIYAIKTERPMGEIVDDAVKEYIKLNPAAIDGVGRADNAR